MIRRRSHGGVGQGRRPLTHHSQFLMRHICFPSRNLDGMEMLPGDLVSSNKEYLK